MTSQYVWIGLSIGLFFAGLGVGYAVFINSYNPYTMMGNPTMFNQMRGNNPQFSGQYVGYMMQNPQLRQQMYNYMLQNQDFMYDMMKNSTFQNNYMIPWIVQNNFTNQANSKNTVNQTAMLERGNIAMGFDQMKIHHHFMATSTGGEIMIMSTNTTDTQTINEIRSHVKDIQYEFSQGNFSKPFYIHDQVVPGTDVMIAKKDLIQYSIKDFGGGSALILTTNDTELLNAIRQFMNFQTSQHMGH